MNMGKKDLGAWGKEKAKQRYAEGGPVKRTLAEALALPANHPSFNESKDTGSHYNWPATSDSAMSSRQRAPDEEAPRRPSTLRGR